MHRSLHHTSRRALTITLVGALLSLLFVAVAVPALAATTVTWSGDLVNNPDGTFENTYCGGLFGSTDYNYQAQPFYVDADGSYTMESIIVNFDIWFVLYEGSFDPANPMTNCITYDDDGAGYPRSRITRTLTANTQYILVTTRCCGVHGTFTNQISGPGNITLGYLGGASSTAAAGPAVRPDDRLNWTNGDNLAVIYRGQDDASNPSIHIYCVGENSNGFIGLVVTEADLANIPAQPASNTLVASSEYCDVEFYVLTTGEYQINITDASSGKIFVTVMADLAGTGAYGYMLAP